MNAKILDPCCGSRMMHFDNHNENVVFGDIRTENHILCDGRSLEVAPDVEMDFRNMPFKDGQFNLVVFDPPHLVKAGKQSWLALKYGKLNEDWHIVGHILPELRITTIFKPRDAKREQQLINKTRVAQDVLCEILDKRGYKWKKAA